MEDYTFIEEYGQMDIKEILDNFINKGYNEE